MFRRLVLIKALVMSEPGWRSGSEATRNSADVAYKELYRYKVSHPYRKHDDKDGAPGGKAVPDHRSSRKTVCNDCIV